MESPLSHFKNLPDPRIDRCKEHLLEDIIFIAISGVICGAEGWNEIAEFGKAKQEWLQTFLQLPHGIPSHDTFNRLFSALDPIAFEKCFLSWTQCVAERTSGRVVSFDGKTIKGSKKKDAKSAIHMVSAWCGSNNIVLGQRKVDEKSNEITAIPELLSVLVLKGCIVTIDAMGCQTNIADNIVEQEADYVLAVKGNQGSLYEQIVDSFRFLKTASVFDDLNVDHGRIEKRICRVIDDLSMIEDSGKWKQLKQLIELESERIIKATGEIQKEKRYYITSLSCSAKEIESCVRQHWGIENSLHWTLDVAFREDHSRKRNGNSAQNYSLLNKIALNLLKNEKSVKVGVKGKRLVAGWNNQYLIDLLKI